MSEEEKHAIEFFNKVIYQIGEEDIMKNNCILLNLIDKLQKENQELSESNFHFLEINQKLIEEKPIIKELTEKELNLLEKIDKLQKDSISKDIIRNFIKEELPDDEIMKSCEMFDMNGVYLRKKLEELLGE